MSYQFEDDSALEELLNQQLERKRRQKPAAVVSKNEAFDKRPSTAISAIPAGDKMVTNQENNFRSDLEQSNLVQEPNQTAQQPKGKLANWLSSNKRQSTDMSTSMIIDNKNIRDNTIKTFDTSFSRSYNNVDNEYYQDNKQLSLSLNIEESELRDMSKQKLIQFYLTKLDPAIKSLQSRVEDQDKLEKQVEELKRKLQLESSKLESIELRHIEKFQLSELSWQQLNKQLQNSLEAREKEFNQLLNKQKDLIHQLDEEQKKHIDELSASYKQRLFDEKKQFEDTLIRRDEFHRLELESKLKINCDINQMELIFAEWNEKIKSTIFEFENHYKRIESLLDKQTIQINSNNVDLTKKSKYLQEQYESLEEKTKKLNKFTDSIDNNWPKLNQLYENNEELVKRINNKLDEFIPLNEELRAQERELIRLKDELREEKEKLSQEKFQLGLDSNRLIYKEERLNQLENISEENRQKLEEQLKELKNKDDQMKVMISNLNSKSQDLREQNNELHLNRKKLFEKEDNLRKLEIDLMNKRNSLDEEQSKLRLDSNKLISFRKRAQKELEQLKRLQKALVCSICLDSLFRSNKQTNIMTIYDKMTIDNNSTQEKPINFNLEMANLKQYVELDGKDLEAENKFIQLLSNEN